MPDETRNQNPDAYLNAQHRLTEAMRIQFGGAHYSPNTSKEERVGSALLAEFEHVLESPRIHPTFQEKLRPFLYTKGRPRSIVGVEFITPEGELWNIQAFPGDALFIKKFSEGRGQIFKFGMGKSGRQPVLTFSEGATDEMRRELKEDLGPITNTTDHMAIGARGILMLDELTVALQNELVYPPSRPPEPERIQVVEEPEPPKPRFAERRAPEGELDEEYNQIPRMGDIIPLDNVDNEDPSWVVSRLCDDSHAWVTWQQRRPFLDENGQEHHFVVGNNFTYYYVTQNEKGENVRLAVKVNEGWSKLSLHIRELKDTETEVLEDQGEVELKSWVRSRFAYWRAPGVDSEAEPTSTFNRGDITGDTTVNPVRKSARAYSMLLRGFLIGFEGLDGGFIPAHRPPKKR